MSRHYAILHLCAVLAVAFYAIGLGMLSGVAIFAGLLFEAIFWVRLSRTRRVDASLKDVAEG